MPGKRGHPPKDGKLPIISSRKDIGGVNNTDMCKFHPLTIKDGLMFTGYELREDALIETPIGGSKANKGDWIVIMPDGEIWRFPKKLFNLMFQTDPKMEMVGKICVQCGRGRYSRLGMEVRCNKCGDKVVT